MFASASWAWRFWASLTEVAYSPCDTIVEIVTPSGVAGRREVVAAACEVALRARPGRGVGPVRR